jgi:hypothetical protein
MTPHGFVIATDSCRERGVVLFMVDRHKQTQSFWSNRLIDVLVYVDHGAAQRKADSLKFNRPRVMSLDEARKLSLQQSVTRYISDDDFPEPEDPGWDAHKDAF